MLSYTIKAYIERAKLTPENDLLAKLEDNISLYALTKKKEYKINIKMYMGMLMIQYSTEGKTINEVINSYEKDERAIELFKPMEN